MDTSSSSPKPTLPNCSGGNCADCIKGGIPLKKESLSFFLILFIIMTTVLGVMLINAKRQLKAAGQNDDAKGEVMVKTSPTPYPQAAPRTYTSFVTLPAPVTNGKFSLEKAIATRRSRREFSSEPVTLAQISQMVWSGQGQTDPTGKRTAPSARESYSMSIFVFVKQAEGINPGLYEYIPKEHKLGALAAVDVATAMKTAGAQQGAIDAPVVFLIASDFGLYQSKTKSADMMATYMEAGHIGQNMYLETESMGMATVTMAGFSSAKMTAALKLDPAFQVEYLMPFGHRVEATNSAKLSE